MLPLSASERGPGGEVKPATRALALLLVLLLAGPAAAARPNVLLILADDLGWSDLGCYGGEIATPHLDALATGGLRFTQMYNGTRCCPSRASLLTGLYPHQAGVGDMTADQGQPGYRGRLQPNTATLAEVLKTAGYRTAMAGKWHLTGNPGPVVRGFDDFYGMIGGFNTCWEEDPHYTRRPAGRPKRPYPPGGFYSTDVFADYSLDFLKTARDEAKPFFLYLAFNAPHFPLHAPKETIAKYADTYAKGWDAVRTERHAKQKQLGLVDARWSLPPRDGFETRRDFHRTGDNPAWDTLPADRRADLARRMAVYAAMVDRMDAAVGRVVADLKAHGELENTLILFLSDNGACAEWDPFGFDESSGPKNVLHTGAMLDRMGGPGTYHSYGSGWANAGNTPWRWYKHRCHEGGISTPLVVHWPAGFAGRGELRKQPAHLIDVMPTLLDVCGAAYPAGKTPPEGVSLRPAFGGQPLPGRTLAWEHEGNKAIRVGDWKAVAAGGGPWELYDVAADRVELNDRAAAEPARLRELTAAWEAWAKRTQVFPKPGNK